MPQFANEINRESVPVNNLADDDQEFSLVECRGSVPDRVDETVYDAKLQVEKPPTRSTGQSFQTHLPQQEEVESFGQSSYSGPESQQAQQYLAQMNSYKDSWAYFCKENRLGRYAAESDVEFYREEIVRC